MTGTSISARNLGHRVELGITEVVTKPLYHIHEAPRS